MTLHKQFLFYTDDDVEWIIAFMQYELNLDRKFPKKTEEITSARN